MIKVIDIVREELFKDYESLSCLQKGTLNLSAYSKTIHHLVEKRTMKEVKRETIVMALSRIKKELGESDNISKKVVSDGLTIKSPLLEFAFEKTQENIKGFSSLIQKLSLNNDEWFVSSQNSSSLIIVCSQKHKELVLRKMNSKPSLYLENLCAVGFSLSHDYHQQSNVVFSLLKKLAHKNIPLSEVISTWGEIILVFEKQYLSEILPILES